MKSETIAEHHALFCILIGLFDALLFASVIALWSIDPRRNDPVCNAAGITGVFSVAGLLILSWLLWRGSHRLALICLLSAITGLVCSMILPAVP
jgi:uncharacterized protein (TIGR03382 family)